MIARGSILSTVEAALEAAADLTGIACIQDMGAQASTIEAQLRDPGTVLVLPPVLKVVPREQSAGSMLADATFMVRLLQNANINAEQSTPRTFEADRETVTEVILALGSDDGHGDRYLLVSDELSEFDVGLLAADLVFTKGCHINAL